jgi:hypothetical protein
VIEGRITTTRISRMLAPINTNTRVRGSII